MVEEYGAASCFSVDTIDYNDVAVLDSTHVVVAYNNSSGSGRARVGVINGDTVTWGAENTFSGAVQYTSVAALDSTHFVIAYRNSSGYATAIIGLVSGTTISSYGTANTFGGISAQNTSVAALDSTHFVVAYRVGTSSGHAIIGSVSGTAISYGAARTFNSNIVRYTSVAVLDSTHFVIAYRGNSNYGTAIIGLVSGTTISSYGAENMFNALATDHISVAALDSTHFAVAYRDSSNNHGKAIIGLVSGTTISSYGAINTFNAGTTANISAAALDSTHFVVAYRDHTNSGFGTAIIGLTSGTTISSYGAENVFNEASTTYTGIAAISSVDFIVSYKWGGGHVRVWWGTPPPVWSGIIIGVSLPAKVMGVAGGDIANVIGVS